MLPSLLLPLLGPTVNWHSECAATGGSPTTHNSPCVHATGSLDPLCGQVSERSESGLSKQLEHARGGHRQATQPALNSQSVLVSLLWAIQSSARCSNSSTKSSWTTALPQTRPRRTTRDVQITSATEWGLLLPMTSLRPLSRCAANFHLSCIFIPFSLCRLIAGILAKRPLVRSICSPCRRREPA